MKQTVLLAGALVLGVGARAVTMAVMPPAASSPADMPANVLADLVGYDVASQFLVGRQYDRTEAHIILAPAPGDQLELSRLASFASANYAVNRYVQYGHLKALDALRLQIERLPPDAVGSVSFVLSDYLSDARELPKGGKITVYPSAVLRAPIVASRAVLELPHDWHRTHPSGSFVQVLFPRGKREGYGWAVSNVIHVRAITKP